MGCSAAWRLSASTSGHKITSQKRASTTHAHARYCCRRAATTTLLAQLKKLVGVPLEVDPLRHLHFLHQGLARCLNREFFDGFPYHRQESLRQKKQNTEGKHRMHRIKTSARDRGRGGRFAQLSMQGLIIFATCKIRTKYLGTRLLLFAERKNTPSSRLFFDPDNNYIRYIDLEFLHQSLPRVFS